MTPRILSQKEYDLAPSGQQRFYKEQEEKGLLVIGTKDGQTVTDASAIKTKDDRKPGPLHRLLNKRVVVSLVTMDRIEGVLTETWQYEIVVRTADGEMSVLKHAIVSMKEVGI